MCGQNKSLHHADAAAINQSSTCWAIPCSTASLATAEATARSCNLTPVPSKQRDFRRIATARMRAVNHVTHCGDLVLAN